VFATGRSQRQEHRSEVDGKYYLRTISPIKGKDGTARLATIISKDINEQKKIEKRLKKQTRELKTKSRNLEKLNTALEVLLNKVKQDRKSFEENVIANVEQLVKPTLKKLKNSRLDKKQAVLADILESNVETIVSPFTKTLSSKYLRFTPSEIQISDLLIEGRTTKEIADLLNLSPRTVETHRRNIRKKLGLHKGGTNLRSYLISIQNE